MSTHHTKQSLDALGQLASMAYLNSGTSLNEGVTKLARQHGLSDDQVSTVCRLANHHVNAAQMSKEAYTEFPVARPEQVLATLGHDKTASLAVYSVPLGDDGLDKTASTEVFEAAGAGDFAKLAQLYGHTLTFTGDREEDGVRFVKAAEIVATRALESQLISKCAADDAVTAYYTSIRRSLLDGVPIEDLKSESERTNTGDMLKRIWPRLEAEALVQTSIRDDAGPYSLERMYKQAKVKEAYLHPDYFKTQGAEGHGFVAAHHHGDAPDGGEDALMWAHSSFVKQHNAALRKDGKKEATILAPGTDGHNRMERFATRGLIEHNHGRIKEQKGVFDDMPPTRNPEAEEYIRRKTRNSTIVGGAIGMFGGFGIGSIPGAVIGHYAGKHLARKDMMSNGIRRQDLGKYAEEDKEALFGMKSGLGPTAPVKPMGNTLGKGGIPGVSKTLNALKGMSSMGDSFKTADVDPGIKAMQDLLFGPFRIADDAPILKQAAAYDAARQRYLVDTRAAQISLAGIAHVDKLAQFDATNRVKAAAATAARRLTTQALGLGKL